MAPIGFVDNRRWGSGIMFAVIHELANIIY
jgi:hypothetical protein